ncbi:hypothetical protein [Mycoplasmopsis sturni]|uniref:hypothetical protein n=1 Tax=Mycoplasmopsis sturni TaxID=39047 RepID=UPI00055F3F65|nr:hypothetical protein [Mycoplasmopsis sturni]
MNVANIDQVKLLAEQIVEAKKELKELNKQLKDLVKDTEVEFNEPLSNGGRVVYQKFTPKPSFNYRAYSAFLHATIQTKTLSEGELDKIIEQFTEQKPDKWKIQITK